MRIFQDKPLVYFILLIISAHLCLNYSNPEIDTNLMPEVLILDDQTVPLYSSFILVDCKIIPDKIIFLGYSIPRFSILSNSQFNSLFHLTIINLNEILSLKAHFYLQLDSKITYSQIEFVNAKIIDSPDLSLLISLCKHKKVALLVGIITMHFLEWLILMKKTEL